LVWLVIGLQAALMGYLWVRVGSLVSVDRRLRAVEAYQEKTRELAKRGVEEMAEQVLTQIAKAL
jgi:hypothetical protein